MMRCNSGIQSKRYGLYYKAVGKTAMARWLGLALGTWLFTGLGTVAVAEVSTAMYSSLAQQSLLLEVAKAGDRLIAVGERGHILYSDDHGVNWQQAEVPTVQTITSVHFLSDKRGWAVGHDGNILLTQDGGEHWTLKHDGLAVEAKRLHTEITLARIKTRRLSKYASENSGNNDIAVQLEEAQWDLQDLKMDAENVVVDPLLDVWFMDQDHGFAVGAFGRFLYTENGGEHWQDWSKQLNNVDELHLNAVTGSSDGNLFVVGEAGGVWRSRDAGLNWQALETPYQGSYFGALLSHSGTDLYIYGLRGHVFHSSDQGDSWRQIDSQAEQTITAGTELGSGRFLFVGAGGVLLVGDSGSNTFTASVSKNRLDINAVTETAGGGIVLLGRGGLQLVNLNSTRLNLANNSCCGRDVSE